MPILKNARHERFAQALAQGKSAKQAYKAAGYKPDDGNAVRLTGNDKVKARVAELLGRGAEKVEITVEEIVRELKRIGLSDIRQAFHPDGTPKLPSEWDDDFAAAVSSLEVVSRDLPADADEKQEPQGHGGSLKRRRKSDRPRVEQVHKFKLADKRSALVDLGRYKGMFKDDPTKGGDIHLHFHESMKVVL